jgi:hypothetical protein
LRRVLATADDVEMAVVGQRIPCRRPHQLGGEAAPLEASQQNGRVAAVPVGAEQLGEQEGDADGYRRRSAQAAGALST